MYRLWYSLFSFNLFTEYDYIYVEKRSPQVDRCIQTVYVTQAHPSQLFKRSVWTSIQRKSNLLPSTVKVKKKQNIANTISKSNQCYSF